MNKRFRHLQRCSWLGIGACLIAAVTWAQALTVIELKHRRAEDLIPVLQPLLEQGGALTGQDYKLFVRASSTNLAQIRSAAAQLDRQQKQMLVSVRRSTALDIQQEQASASGTVSARNGASGAVRAGERNFQTHDSSVSSVQVLEGSSAFIAIGTTVPVVTAFAVRGGRRAFAAGTIEQRNLQRGFMVTPRVNGDQVILEISQQDERVGGNGIQSQSLNTQVIGRVGTWLQLGGISESSSSSNSGILSRSYSTSGSELAVWVKVDVQ